MTTKQDKNMNRNPTGKGGFGDHPELINAGGRPKNAESFNYWMDHFKTLPFEKFKKYKSEHPDMSMAAFGAYARVAKMIDELKEFQEVANRTEGYPKQLVETEDITDNLDNKTVEQLRAETRRIDKILRERTPAKKDRLADAGDVKKGK